MLALFTLMITLLGGCCSGINCIPEYSATGGGRDAVTINLPFADGDSYRCSQGANGAYSHQGTSTRYDADFDTRNDADEFVYAPVGGIAYVHDDDPYTNFGYHVNIDQGDGTYIIMAHFSSIFVEDGSEVAAGQLMGFEGTTGNSTGDHVHIGRHSGDASQDGIYGTSEEGLEFSAADATLGTSVSSIPVTDLVCDLTSGHLYTSVLPVALWHPDGTLVKTPSESTVYLVQGGVARTFITEESFLSRNYDFADIALISNAELACLGTGADISDTTEVSAVYDDEGGTGVWLLQGSQSASDRIRQRVTSIGWQGVLKSWGIAASTYDDLPQSSNMSGTLASYPVDSDAVGYRDGALVSPSDASDVYLMSGGIAMPIETWNTYLLAGFARRTVIEVERSEFESVATVRGSCATDTYCLTISDLATCGGPDADSEGTFQGTGGSSEEDDTGVGEEIPEEDSGGSFESDELVLTWTTPNGRSADRITLSGEYTSAGVSYGWNAYLAETSGQSISYTQSMSEGDSLRFSVEYVVGSSTSWSCIGPFPPGTVQGTPSVTWNGVVQSVIAADDPTSDGCGLVVTVSE